jgi:DNA-binding NarL/FixJ family response regulator
MYQLTGFDPRDGPPVYRQVIDRIHPDDRDCVDETVEHAVRDGTGFEGEYRILMPNGDVRRLRYLGHSITLAADEQKKYAGSVIDVTSERVGHGLPPSVMTRREREIVQLVGEAQTSKQIAGQLGICVKTVESHRCSAMKKLGIRSACGLVRYAIRNGMVRL